MTSTPLVPPAKVLEAEQRLAAVEPVYRRLLAMPHRCARRDIAERDRGHRSRGSRVRSGDVSELLWSQHPDFVAALRSLAYQLEQRRASQPTPPVIEALAAVLRAGRPPAT